MDNKQIDSIIREVYLLILLINLSIFLRYFVHNRILKSICEILYEKKTLLYRVRHTYILLVCITLLIRLIYFDFNMELLRILPQHPYEFLTLALEVIGGYDVTSNVMINVLIMLTLFCLVAHIFIYFSILC